MAANADVTDAPFVADASLSSQILTFDYVLEAIFVLLLIIVCCLCCFCIFFCCRRRKKQKNFKNTTDNIAADMREGSGAPTMSTNPTTEMWGNAVYGMPKTSDDRHESDHVLETPGIEAQRSVSASVVGDHVLKTPGMG